MRKNHRILLTAIISLFVLLSFLIKIPILEGYQFITASADDTPLLYVGSTAVYGSSNGFGWNFDAATCTLTLDNFGYDSSNDPNYRGAGIEYNGTAAITIILSGANNIKVNGNSYTDIGISSKQAAITIDGTGSLEITAESYNSALGLQIMLGTLTIKNGTIIANAKHEGIYAEDISIAGGNVTASGDEYGIGTRNGTITITGGTVNATGIGSFTDAGYGLYSSSGSISISGGTVSAAGKKYGVCNPNYITNITGGTVELTGETAFGTSTHTSIAGTGYDNIEGNGNGTAITADNEINSSFKKIKLAPSQDPGNQGNNANSSGDNQNENNGNNPGDKQNDNTSGDKSGENSDSTTGDKSGENNNENTPPQKGDVVTTDNKMKYEVTGEDTVAFKGTTGNAKSITIPSTVTLSGKSFKVTSIAPKAFKNNKKMTSIVIPAPVTAIGKYAFYGTIKLKKVTIYGNITKFGAKAFYSKTGKCKYIIYSPTKKKYNAMVKKLRKVTNKAATFKWKKTKK